MRETTNRERFVVGKVTGRTIIPGTMGHSNSRPLPTSYYVHDRLDCFRVVAAFDASDPSCSRGKDAGRLELAEARAAELNAPPLVSR